MWKDNLRKLSIEFENKKAKINKQVYLFLGLKTTNELPGANGGGGRPSVYLKNPEDIALVLTDVEDNPVNVDLTFRKKIKVIKYKKLGNMPGFLH